MFGIGLGEFMLILIVALIFISPEKLPEVAKSLAKTYRELLRAGNELKRTVTEGDLLEEKPGAGDKKEDSGSRGPERGATSGERPVSGAEVAGPGAQKDKDGKKAT